MWICRKCSVENESNFNFCWSCGQAANSSEKEGIKPAPAIGDVPEETPVAPVIRRRRIAAEPTPPSATAHPKQVSESGPLKKPTGEIFRPKPAPVEAPEPAPQVFEKASEEPAVTSSGPDVEIAAGASSGQQSGSERAQAVQTAELHQPELFSALFSDAAAERDFAELDTDKQRQTFVIAVRLFGLALLFLFVTGIPDFASRFFAVVLDSQGAGFWRSVAVPIGFPAARLLFYLIGGIYLISSGRILIRLLPR